MFEVPSRTVRRVFLHHSASDNPQHDTIEVIRDWHVNGNGWSDVGYHYFIRADGAVEQGRPLHRRPAAQKGHNTATIAICLHGKTVFTKLQRNALVFLCRQINEAYDGEITFHGHKEVGATACPGYDYRAWLHLDADGYMKIRPWWAWVLKIFH